MPITARSNKEPAKRIVQNAKDDLEQLVRQRTKELIRANESLINDIRKRKPYWETIQLANRKLNTLSSITRHDILNQITTFIMYLSVVQETTKSPCPEKPR